ncbi:hypothetical protein JOM56_006232 [Amanita muscaria]
MSSRQTSAPSHAHSLNWPPEPIPPVGYLSRKALPIKKSDAEPLTRKDVQYDMLEHIFSDEHAAFTSPVLGETEKITFSDLYISTLYNSGKCSKVLKEKMVDTPAFAVELAKISLLTNVGRINTTMAFFPEMKTALRTYHPVPSLQKTDGNAQDAPRIKNCLKAALLPSEVGGVPASTPEEILEKSGANSRPPTSVVNLIFVLANHAAPLSNTHFEGGFNFLDLFLPGRGLASDERGRCFLWMMFYYLEHHESNNPFHDDYSRTHAPKAPRIRALTEEELAHEDTDTPEEIEWGHKMSLQRNNFLQKLVASQQEREKRDQMLPPSQPDKGPSPIPMAKTHSGSKRPAPADLDAMRGQQANRPIRSIPPNEQNFINYATETGERDRTKEQLPHERRSMLERVQRPHETRVRLQQPSQLSQVPPIIMHHQQGRPGLNSPRERSMVEQAWFEVCNTDPLADSDEESRDEHSRQDYIRRREILKRYTQLDQVPDPD